MTVRCACVILFTGLSCRGQEPAARLSGVVHDQRGAVIPRVLVFLESETDPSLFHLTRTDDRGIYRIAAVSPGVYRLSIQQDGFITFFFKAVQLASDEEKSMPLVTLMLVNNGCSGGPLTYSAMPLPHSVLHGGNFAGEVVDFDGTPVADADVSLICDRDRVCTKIRTDSKGKFVFEGVPPGNYGLLIGRSFFYPWFARPLEVRHDQELMYRPISLERCSEKYCDPALQPKPDGTRITICQ